jgi:hypothetical protein
MLEIAETGEEAPMLVLFGVLIAIAPFAVVIGLLAWAAWRERRRREVEDRQIALTDGIHERLGAAAAPIVCRRRRGWQVRMAVPFQRPAVTEALLAIALQAFAADEHDRGSLEVILTHQPRTPAIKPTRGGRTGVAVMDMSDCATGILARDGIGSTAEAPRTSTPEALHG